MTTPTFDIRGGNGERRVFRIILRWLGDNEPESVRRNIDLIPEYGRWDDLLALFGKSAPAIGFTILVDEQMAALSRQDIPISIRDYGYTSLLYDHEKRETAIRLAKDLRRRGSGRSSCAVVEKIMIRIIRTM